MPDIIENDHGAAAILAHFARAAGIQEQKPRTGNYQDAAPFIVLQDGKGNERIEWLTQRQDAPARRTGTVHLLDPASFITYVKLHHNGTPIYGTPSPASFTAVLNEHVGVSDVPGGIADYRDHRAKLTLGFSDEWSAWQSRNGMGKAFESTEEFASFLETNSFDIVEPPATSFLQLALNFHVNESVVFNKQQRLEDGHVQLTFNRIVEGSASTAQGGTIKVPTKFKVRVPVFRGVDQPFYECEAHFRYRLVGNGRIKIWYDLIRPAKVIEQAFHDIWTAIGTQLEVPVLYGTPE